VEVARREGEEENKEGGRWPVVAVLLLTVGKEEDWLWVAVDVTGCPFFFSVFSFCLYSIISSPSLCFSILLLLFSSYGGATGGGVLGGWWWFAARNGGSCYNSSCSLCRDTNLLFSLSYFPLFFSIWFLSILSSSSVFFFSSFTRFFFLPSSVLFWCIIRVGGAGSTLLVQPYYLIVLLIFTKYFAYVLYIKCLDILFLCFEGIFGCNIQKEVNWR
jgi:hypothetical protein